MANEYDLVVRHGTVLDGTGAEAYEADVAMLHGKIAAIGRVSGSGREEVDARGKLVTPGFVDIHTHYDGQATWEDRITSSSAHGVTTVAMGNCGVGFAPCRRQDRERLIDLMEGVEDLPGTVLAEGLTWDWETYPEYLNALERRPHDIDVASSVPHSALRVFVMGERAAGDEEATPQDLAEMARLMREAMEAGAMGFSSSRTVAHRSRSGELVPSFYAAELELRTIAEAMRSTGSGILQFATDFDNFGNIEPEFNLLKRVAKATGCAFSFPLIQPISNPEVWRDILALIEQANAEGVRVLGQAMPRAIGVVQGLELSMHPFSLCESYRAMAHLPLAERVAGMRDPAMRAKLLAEQGDESSALQFGFTRKYAFDRMFRLGNPPDYEPSPDSSLAAEAARRGIAPEALAYDLLLERDGKALIYVPAANYAAGNLDVVMEMMSHKDVILALGDAGAHCGMLCDGNYPTFVLSHWTRDRSKGGRIALPKAIKALTSETAAAIGFLDRGVLALGYKADLNVIDYDHVALEAPHVVHDLPAQGRRLAQDATGYDATIVSGEIIQRDGVSTTALPGRLIRGVRAAPAVKLDV